MSQEALRQAATGGAVANTKPAGLPALLQQMKPQLALALPKHMNPDRVLRIALTELRKTPALMECEPKSVLAGVIMSAQLGLEIGINGQAYLIPYAGKATFVPGWKGLVDLAQRSGRATVWTGAVFEGDTFDFEYGTRPFITHKPGLNFDQKKLTHVYAVGWVKGAEYPVLEIWPMAKVFAHRDRFNKVGKRHYSFEHPEMYGRKVALLQVLKYMPQSIELATAIDLENAAEAGKQHLDMNDAIEGTFTVQAGSTESTPIPEAEALARLKEAGGLSELDVAWSDIKSSYGTAEIPIAVEALYNDRKSGFVQDGSTLAQAGKK